MTPLALALKERIEAAGPLRVDDYVRAALGDAEHGYYATRDPFGRSGDFVTAPEISQVFGELIGAWCAAAWAEKGSPDRVWLVELGPGRGTLLCDALRAIARAAPAFRRALRLALVENSPHLRRLQRQALESIALAEPPVWFDDVGELPPGPVLLIANEFFDALPVRQLIRVADGWRERRIDVDEAGRGFVFVVGEAVEPPPTQDAVAASEGDLLEVCEAADALARTIAVRIVDDGGAALIIDYGHSHHHVGETLQAVRQHRFASVLDRPGEADLSHQVDFGGLAAAAQSAGARVFGPISQGLFLGRLGLAIRAEALIAAKPHEAQAISGQIRRLAHPGRMGMLFKALAIAGPDASELPGFGLPARTDGTPSPLQSPRGAAL